MLAYNCETAIGVGSKSMVLQYDKLATANKERRRSFSGFVSTQDIDFSIKLQKFSQRFAVFSKDGCTHTVKSVLRLTKRPNNVTPRISAHEIHFCHTKTQQNDSCIKS